MFQQTFFSNTKSGRAANYCNSLKNLTHDANLTKQKYNLYQDA